MFHVEHKETRDRSRPLLTADTQSSATQFFDKATDSAA